MTGFAWNWPIVFLVSLLVACLWLLGAALRKAKFRPKSNCDRGLVALDTVGCSVAGLVSIEHCAGRRNHLCAGHSPDPEVPDTQPDILCAGRTVEASSILLELLLIPCREACPLEPA